MLTTSYDRSPTLYCEDVGCGITRRQLSLPDLAPDSCPMFSRVRSIWEMHTMLPSDFRTGHSAPATLRAWWIIWHIKAVARMIGGRCSFDPPLDARDA